jgi:hypothetical protein
MSLDLAIAILSLGGLIGLNYFLIWSIKNDIEEARSEIITNQDGLKSYLNNCQILKRTNRCLPCLLLNT